MFFFDFINVFDFDKDVLVFVDGVFCVCVGEGNGWFERNVIVSKFNVFFVFVVEF